MNTFLPFPTFADSARVLDNKRLNKQIVEAYQLIQGQWPNHPCSKMWSKNIECLKLYFNFCLQEWKIVRGKNHKFDFMICDKWEFPTWINEPLVFFTHKVNLLRKDFFWYSQHITDTFIIENLSTFPEGYFWPVGPLGKIGQEHSDNWLKWANNHKGEY